MMTNEGQHAAELTSTRTQAKLMTIMSPLHKQGYLDEANVLGVAAEALPAAHEPILPDQSMGVSTDPAAKYKCIQSYHSIHCMTNTLGTARLYH